MIVSAKKRGLPIVYVNTAFETLTGQSASDVIGDKLDELVAKGPVPDGAVPWQPDGNDVVEQTWRLQVGGKLPLSVRQTPLFERPGTPSFWLLSVLGPAGEDVAAGEDALRDALNAAHRKLKRLERTDSATGVPNEGAFSETLQRDWAIARREQRLLAVVVFQVDYLDEYRDKLGRHATDSVLRKIAHAINGSLRRAGDFGARVGDSRFAVILGSADDSQVREFAERAAKKVSNLAIPHPKSPVARHITISYGAVSETPEWSSSCNVMFATAEGRLAENLPDPVADSDEHAGATRTDLAGLTR